MKRILIVTKWFYPKNSPRSFRATELALEFARQGHDVTVITEFHYSDHIDFENKNRVKIMNLGNYTWRVPSLGNTKVGRFIENSLNRILSLLFEFPNIQMTLLVNKALKKNQNYDLLISIASPHTIHWGVALARKPSNPIAKIWVADCGDPYMGRENDSFKPLFYFKYVEKWFCRKADYISVPTQGAVEAYYPEFRNKILIIPQGFKFDTKLNKMEQKKNLYPIFAYAGGFIKNRRDPSELMEYLLSLQSKFEFHIYTYMPEFIDKYAIRSDGRIIIHEIIARDELMRFLANVDFLINLENVGVRQTPSKLIDYAILGKPILSIKTGSLNIKHIDEFISGDYRNQFVVPNLDQYRIENVSLQFLSCL